MLLPGDAEGGVRASPQTAPSEHSIERNLLDCCSDALRANILVVGHHGSITSSRTAFLDAVGANTFIVSSGPTKYGSVTLPDSEIITELQIAEPYIVQILMTVRVERTMPK
jgi:competence protein ComEC